MKTTVLMIGAALMAWLLVAGLVRQVNRAVQQLPKAALELPTPGRR